MTLIMLAYFMLFVSIGKGYVHNMGFKKPKEYQTIRLFMILGIMTGLAVLLFRVVLFAPQSYDVTRQPAYNANIYNEDIKAEIESRTTSD
ncbi:hypothetical protein [Pseudobdellovibrio exovorus]|nr:hypothetical protein [Pseudobdellovibrio exovorus]